MTEGEAGASAIRPLPAGRSGARRRVAEAERESQRARAGEQRASFLAEASRLLAGSLDYDTTLATVAGLALPDLGSWCIVDVLEDGHVMRRVAIVHPDPSKAPMLRRLEASWPPERDDPLGLPIVMKTGQPQIVTRIDEEQLSRFAHDEANLEVLRALGLASFLVVPLAARGRVLGAITFVAGRERHYDKDDTELATDLALRSALAIDNARLYREVDLARREAQVASRAKGQFLAVMSHELRTPINAVVGYADLIDMGVGGPITERQREMLGRIVSSTRHLTELIDQILDVARTEAGKVPLQRETASVQDAVASACALLEPEIEGAGLTLSNECGSSPVLSYVGDETRLRQILMNLLSNAAKFTGSGGTITVRCESDGDGPPELSTRRGRWARIDIIDTGIGIDPEMLEAIFQPFRQGDGGLTRTHGGAGLGLAISRQLSRLMGGDLTVSSRPGAGSRFSVWLPAAAEGTPAHRDAVADGSPHDGAVSLQDLGGRLLDATPAILAAYEAHLRSEPGLAGLLDGSADALRDHAALFVAAAAEALIGGDTHPQPGTLPAEGASAMLRTVAELHGERDARVGRTEAQVRTDLRVLRDRIEAELHATASDQVILDAALEIVHHVFRVAERATLRGWGQARSTT
jgi:signal transduction histidine kinase